ncbi:MAG: CHAT domain-containing protein [Balneolaceae bacterium]|nr:CHAT domain-containing protein [Balneolaceae bacterium]
MYNFLKKLLYTVSVFCVSTSAVFAQNAADQFDELFKKGDELYYSYKYDEAIPIFQQTLEIALRENLEFSKVYYSLFSISLSYKNGYKYQEAIDHYIYTIEEYGEDMNEEQLGLQYHQLANVYLETDQFDEALTTYEIAINYYLSSESWEYLARTYTSRGIAYIEIDKYELALQDLKEAEKIVPENSDRAKSLLYTTYYSLYEYLGAPAKGVPYLEKSYELAKKTGRKVDQLNNAIYLANDLINENRYSEGLRYANEGLSLAKETKDLHQLSAIYEIIGRIYYGLAEYSQAVLHFNEAIDIYREINLMKQVAALEIAVARIAFRQGEYETAELLLSDVDLDILTDRYKLFLLLKQADVQIALQNYDRASAYLAEATGLIDEDLAVLKPQIYFMYLKFPDEIISHSEKLNYNRLILRSTDSGWLVNKMGAEMNMARLFEPVNTDSAFFYAYNTIDNLENRRISTQSSTLKNSLNANWQHFYYTVASWEANHNNNYSSTFNLFERAKSRALFDQIYERRFFSLFDADNPSSIRLLELQKKIDRLFQQEETATINDDNSTELQIAELELEYQELQDELIKANPSIQQIEYPEVTTLEETQDMLDNKTAVISYGVTKNDLYTFVIRRDNFKFFEAPNPDTRNQLTDAIEAFRTAIIFQQDEEQLRQTSNTLTTQLLQPILNELDGIEHLIIIPDGPLHLLPFEALMLEDQYLIEKFAIKYTPSISVLNVIQENLPIDFERDMLGLASSGFESGDDLAVARSQNSFSTLPYTLAEIDSIRTSFPGSKILKNEEVTEAAFKNLTLSDYRYLHFATHGNINESVPDQSGLILSKKTETETLFGEDGYLNAREISQLDLRANLVVLSACNTGVGRIINGEGVMGLQRSFLAAGASSVMVSLWNIFDRSTPIFMDLFYENLNEIEDDETSLLDLALMYTNLYRSDIVDFKMLALQKTKKQMIEHPYYNHPVHWAPFVLNGK